jgi:hypothetical protein
MTAEYEGKHGKIRGFVLPSWQGDTAFINRISQGLEPVKRFGGLAIHTDGWWEAKLLDWEPSPIGRV